MALRFACQAGAGRDPGQDSWEEGATGACCPGTLSTQGQQPLFLAGVFKSAVVGTTSPCRATTGNPGAGGLPGSGARHQRKL